MPNLSEIPISHIKVRIPSRRPELITRNRLIDALFDQLDRRLLFVVAPAGYGKTSLLVDLTQQSDLPFCWLSLDSLDQEPQRFLRYLIASIAERFPHFGRDSLLALETMASFVNDEERLLVTITNEINAQIKDHFVLILDDFHVVADSPAIGQIISRFLQLVDENVHLLLASRNLPDLSNAPLLIARNQVGGVTFEDLSFKPDEIQQLFQQNNGIELSLQDAERLVQETEGWIAAIYLTNGNPGVLPQLHPLENTSVLFDFFSKEVMQKQTEQARRFMLLTSMFDAFDASLCQEVLDPLVEGETLDWQSLFNEVRTTNLFSIPLDNEGRWMRYHHLFQHFLKSQLQFEKPVLAWHIQENLAHAYEQRQEWEEALQIYDHLNDYQNQIRVLSQIGMRFIGSGRILTLANWLKKLPVDLTYSQPILLSILGIVYATQGDNQQALNLLNLAEAKLRISGNKGQWTETLARRAEIHRQLGNYDESLNDVNKILELTKDSSISETQIAFAEAQRIKGLTLIGLGQAKESIQWLEDSLQNYRSLGLKANIPILETELGVVHRRLGHPEITARYYASALEALENTGNTGWKASLLNNMGMLKYMTGQLEEAYHLLREAVQTGERCGYVRIQTGALLSLADLLTDLGNFDAAFSHYEQALTLATHLGHSLYIFYASLGEARLKRLRGDTQSAIEELKQTEISQVSLGSFERALYNLELGCCWLSINKFDLADTVLGDAVILFGDGGSQMEQAVARLWLEVVTSIRDPETAIKNLKEYLPPQREWRQPTPLIVHAGQAARWLKKRNETRILKDPYLRLFFEQALRISNVLPELSRKLEIFPENLSTTTPRLKIISFGKVQVRNEQHIVEGSDWQTHEARDLFFYLLQSPPQTKEEIALAFWPDIPPARLKMRFKINLYRIRQALGQDVIIYKDDHYSFNRSIPYNWDREKFDQLYQASQQKSGLMERTKFLEQAIALIKGVYLEDLDAEWAVPDRLKYQDLYQEGMIKLAGIYLQKGRAQECLNIGRELLRSDPLLETAHRLVMEACAALQDPAGMTTQYRLYQKIMKTELGLQPSSEMSALYKQLMNQI